MRPVLLFALFILPISNSLLFSQQAAQHPAVELELDNGALRQAIYLSVQEQPLRVCGLKKGEVYSLWTIVSSGCIVEAAVVGGVSGKNFDFVATGDCMDFTLSKKQGTCEDPVHFSLACKTCPKPTPTPPAGKMGNLAVFGGSPAESLIKDIFIGGNCFDVENVQLVGSPDGTGSFASGSSSIGIESGVILSSGSIYNAPGPNNSNSAGNVMTGAGTDPDLSLLTGGGLFDVVGIEFDFQPTINQITFEFVFASEEYCEWVGSQFNDVFGFFISGPGISGPFSNNGQNIAVIPNTNTAVAINNVNHISNTPWFMPNQFNCNGTTNMQDIQFDGYTVIMQAVANVIPCETYHIRLMISDVGDGIYDSAVFLKANSFSAGGTAIGEVIVPSTGSNFVYEDCADAFITFTRVGGDLSLPFVIDLNLLPSSTATPGVDYVPLPATVVIPPNVWSINLPITVFADGITEGIETIVVGIDNSCSCSSLEMILEIRDTPPLEVNLDDVDLCQGTPLILEPSVSGGLEPYTFQWNNGTQAPFLVAVPTQNTSYSVTISDNCNQSTVESSIITVTPIPSATLSGSGFICANGGSNPVPLSISFTGTGPWVFTYTIDDVPQSPITTMANPYQFVVTEPGIYQMYSVSTLIGNCEGPAIGVAPVLFIEIENLMTTQPVTCQSGGSATAGPWGGVGPFIFEWSNGGPNSPTISDLTAGTYTLTITDQNGCTLEDSAEVTQAPQLEVEVAVLNNVDCTFPGGAATATASGGTPEYIYEWSNGIGNVQNPTGLAPGTYTVTVYDDEGCEQTQTITVSVDTLPPLANADPTGQLDCTNPQIDVTGAASSSGPEFIYNWNGPGIVGDTTTLDISVNQPGTYNLLVTNLTNGCTAQDNASVNEDLALPEAEAAGGIINCSAGEVELSGAGSSAGPEFSYQWTGPGIVSGENTLNPIVNLPGTYNLEVANDLNGCTQTGIALVEADSTYPEAAIEGPLPITCANSVVVLDGSASSNGPEFTYQWFLNGNAIPGATDAVWQTDAPGTYAIQVMDTGNGCSSNEDAEVLTDYTAPEAYPSVSSPITCVQEVVGLSANVVGDPSNYTYVWSGPGILSGEQTDSPSVSEPGLYELVVTSVVNGCSSIATVQVAQDASIPVVSIVAPTVLNCFSPELTLDATASTQNASTGFVWSTSGGNIVSGGNTLSPVIDQPGTYNLTISDSANNCVSEDSITITSDFVYPDLQLPAPMTLTCSETSFLVSATVSNLPSGQLSYSWTTAGGIVPPPGNSSEISVEDPGTYTLLVTNDFNGCTTQQSVEVLENVEYPLISLAEPATITCAVNTVTLDAGGSSFGAGYSIVWSTQNGNMVAGTNGLNPVVNTAGDYVLTITNTANNCVMEDLVAVEEHIVYPQSDAGIAMTLNCFSPELNLQGSGSVGAEFSYQWTGPGLVSGGGTLAPTINQPGTYELVVTDLTNECSSVDAVSIDQDFAVPTADAGVGSELSCTVTSFTLDGSASNQGAQFAYQWSTGNGHIVSGEDTPAPVIDAPGNYLLSVANTVNGCTSTDEVVMTEDDDLPDVTIANADAITCAIAQVTLDASGSVSGPNFEYLWSTSNGSIVSGSTTPNPVVDQSGTYLLTITNLLTSCANSESVLVDDQTALPNVEAGAADLLTCAQTSISLNGDGSATGGNIQYAWSGPGIVNSGTTLYPTVDQQGTYQLRVTNTLTGCTNTDVVIVDQDIQLPSVIILSPDLLTCSLISLDLNGSASSGGPGFSYNWTTSDGHLVSGTNSLTPTIDQPGTYLLTITNDLNGCTSQGDVYVDQDVAVPTADAGSTNTLTCDSPVLNLDGTGSSVGSQFDYLWNTSTGHIVTGGTTLSPTVDQPGDYALLVSNQSNGCAASSTVAIGEDKEYPFGFIAPPGLLTCDVLSVQLTATAAVGNELQYQWYTTNGHIASGSTTLAPTVDEAGTYHLQVLNQDNGCEIELQVDVSRDVAVPVADAGSTFVLDCFETLNYLDGKVAGATGPVSWSWTTVDGNILNGANTSQPAISKPGTYLLVVTNTINGCSDNDHVTITRDEPTAEPEIFQPPCYGDKGAISLGQVSGGTPPYQYSLDGGYTFGNTAIFTHLDPDVYPAVVQDANGCIYEEDVFVEQPIPLDLVLKPHVEISLGDSYQINVQVTLPLDELTQITWFPSENLSCSDCLNPLATPTSTTLYNLTVVSENGCEDSAPILLIVNKQASVYVPNAFSPNGDGTNDVFMIYADAKSVVKIKSFLVFNRWGESVFQYFEFDPNNPAYGWDGTHRGQPLDPAVFAWFAEVEFLDGRSELFEGDVNLLK